jgi:PadR family transcriptional regulator PadR
MIILHLLAREPMYGFELITSMRERTNGSFEMKEGTLYPVLYRMEEANLVEARWEAEGRGVPRKYYHVTERGTRELARMVLEWNAFTKSIGRLLDDAANN